MFQNVLEFQSKRLWIGQPYSIMEVGQVKPSLLSGTTRSFKLDSRCFTIPIFYAFEIEAPPEIKYCLLVGALLRGNIILLLKFILQPETQPYSFCDDAVLVRYSKISLPYKEMTCFSCPTMMHSTVGCALIAILRGSTAKVKSRLDRAQPRHVPHGKGKQMIYQHLFGSLLMGQCRESESFLLNLGQSSFFLKQQKEGPLSAIKCRFSIL